MKDKTTSTSRRTGWSRRKFLKLAGAGGLAAAGGVLIGKQLFPYPPPAGTFIASVASYQDDLVQILRSGMKALSFSPSTYKGKRILIKPNLVEPHSGIGHINTHPLLVKAVVELFRSMDAAEVVVAEGAGHRRDSLLVIEESGFADVLFEDRIPFFDLNSGPVVMTANQGNYTKMQNLFLPQKVLDADVLVSVAKMKTHHWAGVTLSMKNLFGIMPGCVYGWPKNVLHHQGIQRSIVDINATVRPHLSIVDGIVGMEGDGPIMGTPIPSNVLVMGNNSAAVDATCARIMGIDPEKIPYLRLGKNHIGPISQSDIEQRGEKIQSVRKDYQLIPKIEAHQGIRL